MAFYARSSVNGKECSKIKIWSTDRGSWVNWSKSTTVSVRHLAPKGDDYNELNSEQNDMHEQNITEPNSTQSDVYQDNSETINVTDDNLNENEQIITETPPNSNELDIKPVFRRSERIRWPPDRLEL